MLNLKELASELNKISAIEETLKIKKSNIKNQILEAYKTRITEALKEKPEPYGSVSFTSDGVKLKIDTPKKVSWDQEKLAAIVNEIVASGHIAADYVDIEYNVPESKYKAWPSDIKNEFIKARTIEPGNAKVELEISEGEQNA